MLTNIPKTPRKQLQLVKKPEGYLSVAEVCERDGVKRQTVLLLARGGYRRRRGGVKVPVQPKMIENVHYKYDAKIDRVWIKEEVRIIRGQICWDTGTGTMEVCADGGEQ